MLFIDGDLPFQQAKWKLIGLFTPPTKLDSLKPYLLSEPERQPDHIIPLSALSKISRSEFGQGKLIPADNVHCKYITW